MIVQWVGYEGEGLNLFFLDRLKGHSADYNPDYLKCALREGPF